MEIEIRIDRPWYLLGILLSIAGLIAWAVGSSDDPMDIYNMGGSVVSAQEEVLHAEDDAKHARQQRSVLERKEEILRYQLKVLEDARRSLKGAKNKELEAELGRSTDQLIALLRDKRQAEEYLKKALQEIWEAELRGGRAGIQAGHGATALYWPVEPAYGISAHFLDKEYENIFGLPHNAVDIPVEQGSVVQSAGDGTVEEVVDNGYGYSYIIIKHKGVATLYGHVNNFLVEKGQSIRAGDPIAHSGGQPGTRGAGALSTGPHLHFETIVEGEHQDPLRMLPSNPSVH